MRSFSEDDQDLKTNNVRNMPQYKNTNLVVAVLLVLVVIFTAYFAYMKNQGTDLKDFSLKNLFGSGASEDQENVYRATSSIPYESKENTVFAAYKDYIVKAGIDGIEILDQKGTSVWHDALPMSRPVLRSNGSDLLVADLNGLDYVVINGKAEKWKGKSEGTIINADINSDGHVAILNKTKRYGGEAIIYDAYGVELFKTFISDNSPVSVRISPSSDMLGISCINTDGSSIQTYLKLYNMQGDVLAGKLLDPAGAVYPMVSFAGEDTYLAGDTAVTLVNSAGEQKWTKKYDAVYSACMAGSRNIAAAVEENKNVSLKILGTNGHELAAYDIGTEVKNLSSSGNIIAINAIREVYFVNDRGTLLGKYTSKADISEVLFLSKYEAAVVSKSSIAFVNMK